MATAAKSGADAVVDKEWPDGILHPAIIAPEPLLLFLIQDGNTSIASRPGDGLPCCVRNDGLGRHRIAIGPRRASYRGQQPGEIGHPFGIGRHVELTPIWEPCPRRDCPMKMASGYCYPEAIKLWSCESALMIGCNPHESSLPELKKSFCSPVCSPTFALIPPNSAEFLPAIFDTSFK